MVRDLRSFVRADAGDSLDGRQWKLLLLDHGDDVRPGCIQLPGAGRLDCFKVDIAVGTLQRFKNLIVEAADPSHGEDRSQPPFLVATGVDPSDGNRMPIRRSAH